MTAVVEEVVAVGARLCLFESVGIGRVFVAGTRVSLPDIGVKGDVVAVGTDDSAAPGGTVGVSAAQDNNKSRIIDAKALVPMVRKRPFITSEAL